MPITTLDDLRTHLQWAIELEHATIPPYLCALYSIQPGTNRESAETITSVFIEEMLHMTLAANVLNAIGGRPVIDKPDFLARYPTYLPHSADAFLVPLARFAPATIEIFLKIEKPEPLGAPPEGDHFHTIGQFYEAIGQGLRQLCERIGEKEVFCGDPARQVTPAALEYTGSGRVITVADLASALAAIEEIEERTTSATGRSSPDVPTSAATRRPRVRRARRSRSTGRRSTRCATTRAPPTFPRARRCGSRWTSSIFSTATCCARSSRPSTASRSGCSGR